jgi:outer membrane protein OmpA-like peptidoglycan-associated protein
MLLRKNGLMLIAPVLLLALSFQTGCATKKYVKQQIDPLSGRVDELSELSKGNENAIKNVDSRAQAGIQTVQAAASEADHKALVATQKGEEAQQLAQKDQTQIANVENNFNQKLNNLDSYKTVNTSSINFMLNSAELNDEAKATLDQLASTVKDSKGYVLEIQGFTDKTGSDSHNFELSQERSQSVVRYLSQQHQIPLFRMFILGLGSSKEVENNKTRKGRAANRRVEITLLKSELESIPSGSAQK